MVEGREEAAPERAEGGAALRAVGETVALVSASALVGGGLGMLAGVGFGALNPYALGIIGAMVGAGVPVLLTGVVGAREAAQRPWWRRVLFGR